MSTDMTPDREHEILLKVQKLLSVQGRTPEETAAYAAKAQELIEAYNLDVARLDEAGEGGRRAEEKFRGGFYEFERDIWTYVADLNFCLYWSQKVRIPRTRIDERSRALKSRLARETVVVRQHRLVGRRVNVIAAQNMATYLLGAIERICQDWLGEGRSAGDLRSRRAVSFREGAAEDIVGRLWDRRQDQMREDARRQREAEEAAVAAGMEGVSTATALTISTVRQSERDANMDFLYGEGFSARRAAEAARQAQARREAEEAYTRWAAENPEEAAREEEKRRKEERKRSSRSRGRAPREKDRDWGAFGSGREAGASISLDQQVGERSSTALPRPGR